MYASLPKATEGRESLGGITVAGIDNRVIQGTNITIGEWRHRHHVHINMSYNNPSSQMNEFTEPEWTYEKLEKELYHKGNGNEMIKRKVGNNTWLIRDTDRVTVRLHNTDILTYYPDGRVVLNAATWTTATTRDRMNAFLGWSTIYMERGDFYVNVNFRRYDAQQQKTVWLPGRVHFANHMTLDVRTHEILTHPDQRFTKVDDSIVMREAADLSRVLGQETKYLIDRLRDDSITRDDLRHALLMVNTYREERERLLNQMKRLESAMDWSSTTLEDTIEAAILKHGDIQHERRGRIQKLFDPEEIEPILDEIFEQL